jgi:hypothetical protein
VQLLSNGESLPDPLNVRLRLLWDFGVAREARDITDKLLHEDLSDAERNLIEWFIDAHQQVSTSATDL